MQPEPVDLLAQVLLLRAASVDAQGPAGVVGGHLGEGVHQPVVPLDGDEPAGGDDDPGVEGGAFDGAGPDAVGHAHDGGADVGQGGAVLGGVGLGDGDVGVQSGDGPRLVGAQRFAVLVEAQVLLADAEVAVAAVAGEVAVEVRAGGDDHVGLGVGEEAADACVLEPGVGQVPGGPAVREHRAGPLGERVVALVAGGSFPQVDQRGQPDARIERECRFGAGAVDADDLDVVPVGERGREVGRRADGATDTEGVVDQKSDLHMWFPWKPPGRGRHRAGRSGNARGHGCHMVGDRRMSDGTKNE